MNTAHKKFQGLVRYVLMALMLVMAPAAAHADGFDDFIGFYADVEDLAQDAGVSLPFSSQQAKDAKTFVQCLDQAGDNDVQIAICIGNFKDTSTGSTISQQSGIPSWVSDLLDCYIYYRTQDWWGLGYKLGEAAVCLVLQVVTGGADICGILEELVDLANAVWDAAVAVGQFLASVGEAAWEGIKDVGCALGIGGCDDGPPTPPEVLVYRYVFDSRLGEGLPAREAIDPAAFDNLISILKQNALHKPEPITSVPLPPDVWGIREILCKNFTPAAVEKAAEIYTLNVNIQWTNDIAQNVLKVRAKKLSDYASPQNLDYLAQLALSAYTPRSPWDPQNIIINQCSKDLKKEYAHIDRWLMIFPISKRGPQAEAIAPTVKSNYHVSQAFYNQVKNEIFQRIRTHVIQHYDSDIGGKLVSKTIDNHRCCLELMKPFGQETQCWANTAACGKEARLAIIKEFKEDGTQFYGGMSLGLSPNVSNMLSYEPQEFLCYRPAHVYYFDFYYDKLYKDLPRKLLKSKLQEDSAYVKLKSDVLAAVNQLNSQYDYVAFGVDKVDPVMVEVGCIEDMEHIQTSPNNFHFGPPSKKPGFEFLQGARIITIDGRTTPLMYFDIMKGIKKTMLKMEKPLNQKDLSVINPKDPITNPVYRPEAMGQKVMQTPNQMQALSPTLQTTPKEMSGAGGGTATQPMSGTLPDSQTPQTGPGTIQTPVQIKPLSPEVITTPKGINSGQTTKSTNDSVMMGKTSQTGAMKIEQPLAPVLAPPVLPELMAEPQIVVGGIRTGWGKTVALTSETPVLKVPMEFKIRNKGMGASKGFTVNCISAGRVLFQKNVNPLKPGEAIQVKASADLTHGNHLLSLTLDSSGIVMENNEVNNRYEIRLNVSMKSEMNIQKRIAPIPMPTTLPSRN